MKILAQIAESDLNSRLSMQSMVIRSGVSGTVLGAIVGAGIGAVVGFICDDIF